MIQLGGSPSSRRRSQVSNVAPSGAAATNSVASSVAAMQPTAASRRSTDSN